MTLRPLVSQSFFARLFAMQQQRMVFGSGRRSHAESVAATGRMHIFVRCDEISINVIRHTHDTHTLTERNVYTCTSLIATAYN